MEIQGAQHIFVILPFPFLKTLFKSLPLSSPCVATWRRRNVAWAECLSESLLLLEGEWEEGRGGRENPGRFLRLGATLLALSHSSPPGFTCARHTALQATPARAGVGLPESRAWQCRRRRTHRAGMIACL